MRSRLRWVSVHFFPHRLLWRPYVETNAGLEIGWLWLALDIGFDRVPSHFDDAMRAAFLPEVTWGLNRPDPLLSLLDEDSVRG